MTEPIERMLREKSAAIHRKVWPPDETEKKSVKKTLTSLELWAMLDSLLVRGTDEVKLRQVVHECVEELLRTAPDARREITPWIDAVDQFLAIKKTVHEGGSNAPLAAVFNDWLLENPPERCRGLLDRFHKLAEWLRGSFAELVRKENLAPELQISRSENDPGVALDSSDASAVVITANPTSSGVDEFRVTARKSALIIPKKGTALPLRLEAGAVLPLTLSFSVSPGHEKDDPLPIEVSAQFTWGAVKDNRQTARIEFPRFRFTEFLGRHGLAQDTCRRRLDTDLKEDSLRLFVGREKEIEFIRRNFAGTANPPDAPVYYYGIRRVGKTSLLRRISQPDVISLARYLPLYINLFGLQPKDPLVARCRMIRDRAVEAFREQRPSTVDQAAPDIAEAEDYTVREAVDRFLTWLSQACAPQVPLVLVDEFHYLVTQQAASLLDLIRRHNENGSVRFILAGWKDHDVLRQECEGSQLWPLEQRRISFLSREM